MSEHGMKSRRGASPDTSTTSARVVRETSPPVMVPRGQLRTHFQPIVSIREGTTWGVEALSRAIHGQTGQVIPPLLLFADAARAGLLAPFDKFCRRHAVECFVEGAKTDQMLLTLNWDTRTLGETSGDPHQFARNVERNGLAPERVVIEVLEGRAPDLDALVDFVAGRRSEGFLIAVDDYGTGHSTPERLVRIEPDIVKIDRTLVHQVASSPPRREACRSIAELARSIGALVIAEGVEREEDLVELAMLGVDLFQGYLLARPGADLEEGTRTAEQNVASRRPLLRARAEAELARKRSVRRNHARVVGSAVDHLALAVLADLEIVTASAVDAVEGLEALYVLDERGVQLTSTWIGKDTRRKPGFRPAARGTDLALKDYYLEVAVDGGAFTTRPYVSMASGRLCVTHSQRSVLGDGTRVIVCCDVPDVGSG